MIPDLEKLVRLQRAESELRKAESELQEVPRLKDEQAARLMRERARLDASREGLAQSHKARRQLEGELQELEAKRSKYKGQLMEVKTNKEYTAMLHEIEGVEREVRGREDLILGEMEKAESLTAEVKREEGLFRSREERHKTDVAATEARRRALEAETQRLQAERDAMASALPPDTLELFQRVAKLRGAAVAEAKDGMCQLCHVTMRLQLFMDIKRNEQIVQCPSCSRILYYEPPVPVSAPQP